MVLDTLSRLLATNCDPGRRVVRGAGSFTERSNAASSAARDAESRPGLGSPAVTRSLAAGDVAEPADARRMIETAVRRYGRLDVLVANAGIIPFGNVLEATPESWDQVMAVDGRGMFLTCKYAIEAMLATGGGAIVCLSSISGVAGQKHQATYGPAKFVATGLTKHLAIEWAHRGIRVNAVAPGTIRTERVRRLHEEP